MNYQNSSLLNMGPTSAEYDSPLSNISFNNGVFSGFKQDSSYLIMVNMEMKNNGSGTNPNIRQRSHNIVVRSNNQQIASTVGVYTVLPDSLYDDDYNDDDTSYITWSHSVNMQVFAKFQDSDPAENTVRVQLNSNQSQYYFANLAYVTFIKLG